MAHGGAFWVCCGIYGPTDYCPECKYDKDGYPKPSPPGTGDDNE